MEALISGRDIVIFAIGILLGAIAGALAVRNSKE